MAIHLVTPARDDVGRVVRALRDWQRDDAPLQLHPGDVGWFGRLGADVTAAALRTWTRGGRLVAIGLLDGPDVLRATVAPDAWHDDEVARAVAADVADPARGVLPAGRASVEAPNGTAVQDVLAGAGWDAGERWTPLRRDLAEPVEATDLRVEVVAPGDEGTSTALHRAAWGNARFTDEAWRAMASGPAFADARCLLGRDAHGVPVAGVTVWPAGSGRPGLLEPMGVHPDHRGRGHGRAICLAAAAALRRLGASSALVCTPSDLTPAVATYRSAGFTPQPERRDRTRAA